MILLTEMKPVDLRIGCYAGFGIERYENITGIGIGVTAADCQRLPGAILGQRDRAKDLIAHARFVDRERSARTLYADREGLFVVGKKGGELGISAVFVEAKRFAVGTYCHTVQKRGTFRFNGLQTVDCLILNGKGEGVKIEVAGI